MTARPILPGVHPDPSICRVGDEYLLETPTFEYVPGVPIHRSADLVTWQLVGHALTDSAVINAEQGAAGGSGPDRVSLGVLRAGEFREIATLDGRYLSTEVAGGFTGRMLGIEALGGEARIAEVRYAPSA